MAYTYMDMGTQFHSLQATQQFQYNNNKLGILILYLISTRYCDMLSIKQYSKGHEGEGVYSLAMYKDRHEATTTTATLHLCVYMLARLPSSPPASSILYAIVGSMFRATAAMGMNNMNKHIGDHLNMNKHMVVNSGVIHTLCPQ